MRNWWFIYTTFFVLLSIYVSAQSIGLSFGTDVVENKFFPESNIERNDIFYSYRTGNDAENLHVISTHYDIREASNFSTAIFLQDVFKLSFLNYAELSYSNSKYDIV